MYSAKNPDNLLNYNVPIFEKVFFCKWDLEDFGLDLPVQIQIREIMAGCYRFQASMK